MSGTPPWIERLFAALDAQDVPAWMGFLSEDATFRYGSLPPISGRPSIEAFVTAFLGGIRGFSHRLINVWTPPGSAICQGEVHYVLQDGREITVPFTNVFHTDGETVREYLVYIDPTPLAPA